MATAVQPASTRNLISPALHDRLTRRITADHLDISQALAERIVDQTLAFLATCATTTKPIGPSATVDIGWHAFLLHTADYAHFCQQVAGRFIHHNPTDSDETGPGLADTVAAIRANGHRVDTDLWFTAAECTTKDCTQCHSGCTDSPNKP